MPRYDADDADEVKPYLDRLLPKYVDLDRLEFRPLILFARPSTDENGEPRGFAITKNKRRAAWEVKPTKPRMRAGHRRAGNVAYDAEILFDAELWDEWSEARRLAMVESTLYAIEVKKDSDDHYVSDEDGRPVLKVRQPDIFFEGYAYILSLHGPASLEAENFAALSSKAIQMELVFDRVTAAGQQAARPAGPMHEDAPPPIGADDQAPADEWREVKLSAFLPKQLADWFTAITIFTVGRLADVLADGMKIGDMVADMGDATTLALALKRFKAERGGEALQAIKDEWLVIEVEAEPAKPIKFPTKSRPKKARETAGV